MHKTKRISFTPCYGHMETRTTYSRFAPPLWTRPGMRRITHAFLAVQGGTP